MVRYCETNNVIHDETTMKLISTRNMPSFAASCAIRESFKTSRLLSSERQTRPLVVPRVGMTHAALDADIAIMGTGVGDHGAALTRIDWRTDVLALSVPSD